MSAVRTQLSKAYYAGISSAQGLSGADLDQKLKQKLANTVNPVITVDGARLDQQVATTRIDAGPVA